MGRSSASLARNWFLLGCFTALSLVFILEVGARLFFVFVNRQPLMTSPNFDWGLVQQRDPDLLWSVMPNKEFELPQSPGGGAGGPRVFFIRTNELGMRNPALVPKGGRFRIVALGDSTTFGVGVEEEEAWPAQLQALLDGAGKNVEVINAGFPGSTSYQGLRFLEKNVSTLEPDVVVATYGRNDGALSPFSDSEIARMARKHTFWDLVTMPMERKERHGTRLSPEEFLHALLQIRQVCVRHGTALVVLKWPSRAELSDAPNPLPSYLPVIEAAARMTGTPMLDLTEDIRRDPQDFYVDDVHATPAGCRVVARRVADILAAEFKRGMGAAWFEAQAARAAALEEQGGVEGALDLYSLLNRLNPASGEIALCLAQSLERQGDIASAREVCRRAIAHQPEDAALHRFLVSSLAAYGTGPNDLELCRSIVQEEPENWLAWALFGTALSGREDSVAAIDAYLQATALNPLNAALEEVLGKLCLRQQDIPAAILHLRRSLTLNPESAQVRPFLIQALCEARDYDAARREVEESIRAGVAVSPPVLELLARQPAPD